MNYYGAPSPKLTYWSDHGYSPERLPSAPESLRLLRCGSIYVDSLGWYMAHGVSRYRGRPEMVDQELAWPREGATDNHGRELWGVPLAIERATYEATIFEHQNPGALNVAAVAGQIVESEKVDSIAVTYAKVMRVGDSTRPVIPRVEAILAEILRPVERRVLVGRAERV